MQTNNTELVQVKDDRVVIGPVTARWPNLTEKNNQFGTDGDARFTVAVQLETAAAEPLRRHMKSILDPYLKANPKSAEMEVAPIGKDLGNGIIQFELQNRHQKPPIVDSNGKPYDGPVTDRSTVRLVAEPITYTDNRSDRTGVSLRVRAVEVVSNPPSDLELLGHSPTSTDDDGWEDDDDWDD